MHGSVIVWYYTLVAGDWLLGGLQVLHGDRHPIVDCSNVNVVIYCDLLLAAIVSLAQALQSCIWGNLLGLFDLIFNALSGSCRLDFMDWWWNRIEFEALIPWEVELNDIAPLLGVTLLLLWCLWNATRWWLLIETKPLRKCLLLTNFFLGGKDFVQKDLDGCIIALLRLFDLFFLLPLHFDDVFLLLHCLLLLTELFNDNLIWCFLLIRVYIYGPSEYIEVLLRNLA